MGKNNVNRRKFINMVSLSAIATGGLVSPAFAGTRHIQPYPVDDNINHIGPKEGYTPQIGTLISMLDWISDSVVRVTKNLSVEQLDYLHDKDSNTIGSLIMHVAATEVIYQDLTFDNHKGFSKKNEAKWKVAMDLGEEARTAINGNTASYYADAIQEARARTKSEMKKRDDNWLLSGETKEWDWNNYCKWFHVVEHFANHRGQITWYTKRLPK